jgi:hypothetical protein
MNGGRARAVVRNEHCGARGGYLIVNMDDASQLPAMAEPLFFGMGATIQVHLVMTPEDLQKATPALEQAAQKYG